MRSGPMDVTPPRHPPTFPPPLIRTQILELEDSLEHLDDTYWRLRAEVVPEDELSVREEEGERLLHCYHMCRVRPVGCEV